MNMTRILARRRCDVATPFCSVVVARGWRLAFRFLGLLSFVWLFLANQPCHLAASEDWLQFKYDSRHSGNAADRRIQTPLGLIAAIPQTDAVLTSPVICDGCVYVLDASGVLSCFDNESFELIWRYVTESNRNNANNVSSPAIAGDTIHFGTTSGFYYVLNRKTGSLVRRIDCGEPIFSCPVIGNDRVYFASLGAKAYCLHSDGRIAWKWDFVKQEMGFAGDRWDGRDWQKQKQNRVNWKDHFCCSRNVASSGKTLVMPAGGRTVLLKDAGDRAELIRVALIPDFAGGEYAATFGQSVGEHGEVFVQWHRRDNAGRVEIISPEPDAPARFISGTQTAIQLKGLLSFSSVSQRGDTVYRCRPEAEFGFCEHSLTQDSFRQLAGFPSIAAPVLTKQHGVYGGLDGMLHIVPLSGDQPAWSFATAWRKAITAPAAVCDNRVYFGCDDGYLYVLGPGGSASLPEDDLGLTTIRKPLAGPYASAEYDWFTNYADFANTNAKPLTVTPPLSIDWIRRYNGTFKHLPVCGGGRTYTHTAEGQIFAVEQTTGRLLWRRYWPGVYLSFTSPLYYRERLLVPQAGLEHSFLRCLDAATGDLIWEAPFTGSPSWSRQAPPVISGNLAIYASGSGQYAAQGTEKAFIMKGTPEPRADDAEVMSWIYSHNNPYYPKDNRPLIWAWNLETGQLAWVRDFSNYGRGGNDCGLCLLNGTLYYSTFFGYSPNQRKRRGLQAEPNGITAALDPSTGETRWLTTKYSVTAGCTISGKDGRLYVGGYNPPDEGTTERYIFCLDARDGSLIWRSEPVRSAVNAVTLGQHFLFSNASGKDGHVFDWKTGRILSRFNFGYACTRFTMSGPYVLGANMDMIDLSRNNQLVSTGPCVDSRECVAATVSNGRVFYTSQASGLQLCLTGKHGAGGRSPYHRQ